MSDLPQGIDRPRDEESPGANRSVSLGELFERGAHLYSTRTSEAFEAVEVQSGQQVLLWLLRFPLGEGSLGERDFITRLEHIRGLLIPTPRFRAFGVDAGGNAFLATDYVRAKPILDSVNSADELAHLYMEAVKAVVPMHLAGLSLGDICADSFAADSSGQILLLPLIGTFETGARQTAMLPPSATLHYLAPEQRMGSGPDIAADVYALGVFGYRLFTGRYLYGDRVMAASMEEPASAAPAPGIIRSDLPLWVDDVLGRCLESEPSRRFRDAAEMLEVIQQALETGYAPGGASPWSRRTMIVDATELRRQVEREEAGDSFEDQAESGAAQPTSAQKMLSSASEVPFPPAKPEEDFLPADDRALTMFIWALALVLGVLGAGFIFFSIESWELGASEEGALPLAVESEYISEQLKSLIAIAGDANVEFSDRAEALRSLAESEDPAGYSALVSFLHPNRNEQLRNLAEQLLFERVRGQSLGLSADILRRWSGTVRQGGKDPTTSRAYPLLLRACDKTRSIEARNASLVEAYTLEQAVSLQLAAALALDGESREFVPVLRRLLAAEIPSAELQGRGLGALLLSHASLAAFIAEGFKETVRHFSDEDLLWALERLAGGDSPLSVSGVIFDLAEEAIRRRIVSPYRSVFLETMTENGINKTTIRLQQDLIKAALGKADIDVIQEFGRWDSLSGERVLLAVCATEERLPIALAAFDLLARRPLQTEPAKSLVAWIDSRFREHRKNAVKAIGVLGLLDIAAAEDLRYAFEALMPFSQGGLFRVLVNTGNEYLVKEAVSRLSAITSSNQLLPLLSHPSREVRIGTIRALEGRNELGVLQAILRAYKAEKDPAVREVFSRFHWVTRDRSDSTASEVPGAVR